MASLHLPAGKSVSPFGAGSEPTMSSREIADLCGARHNDVVETILRLFEKGVLRESRNTPRSHQPPGGGRPTEVYDLTKRDTLVVVSGYSDEVRARIIDRWMELEAGLPALPRDYPSALRQLASAAEQIGQQSALITTMAPKAAAYDQMSGVAGSMPIRHSAKLIGLGPAGRGANSIFLKMRAIDWIHKEKKDGPWIASQPQINKGYLVQKARTVKDQDGNLVLREQCRITLLGVRELAKKLGLTFDPSLVTDADFGDDDDE
jgi:phage antirepressor YoqD-like protein